MAAATLTAFDQDTGDHSDDVVTLSEAIADRLGVPEEDHTHLSAAARLHDVGKVTVPPHVLGKAGKLEDEEWRLVRKHTLAGEMILSVVPELGPVAKIVRHSHERYDGAGYPDGLAGEEIPLTSRIVFCADAFHAIRSDRPYRRGRSAQAALAEVEAHAGTQFDPVVVSALTDVARAIRRQRTRGMAALVAKPGGRRLAALLLVLTMGGSALAATGRLDGLPLFGGGPETAAASSGECGQVVCLPGVPGFFGRLPVPEAAATAAPAGRQGEAAWRGKGSRRKGASVGGNAGAGERAPAARTRRGAAGTGAAAPQVAPAPRTPKVKRVKPVSPGRSGEAPRQPAAPGQPVGGAPGRSEEAPAKPPALPGQFGKP